MLPDNVDELQVQGERLLAKLLEWAMSPAFYAQVAAIVAAVLVAHLLTRMIRSRLPLYEPGPDQGALSRVREMVHASRDLLFPITCVLALAASVEITTSAVGTAWLVRLAQSVAVVNVLYATISRFITHPLLRAAGLYILIPVAALKVFGWFDETVAWLDGLSFEAGNIRLSLLTLIKAVIFGSLLFWLGRVSNDAGQKVIRKQEALDVPTRELFAKLLEIGIFCAVFVLLLQFLGLDLTALAIFGGAVGVGIGFGLQQIAANFISGVIILLERSLKVGDYIEMDGGKSGILKELNMRSTTLETYDGKEILVPNEKLITTSFTNWTKSNTTHQLEVTFQVPYGCDVHEVRRLVETAAGRHPAVLKQPDAPVCELRALGDKSLAFALLFWVRGVESSTQTVPAQVRVLVWEALRDNGLLPKA